MTERTSTTTATPRPRTGWRRWSGNGGRRLEILLFAMLAYVPFLLSSPGKVSADTKAYLYLDPGRLLARAPYLWDAHVGAGTVPHQNIGYLFPMGPYYWVMSQLQVPDWIAQRLWLGSISFAAALGVIWLFSMLGIRRAGVIAGAVVFMLTPYQLAFTARISAILLPWAALPWLVGLVMRAARRGGWRDPILFAFVVFAVGGTSAASLVLVGIGPVLWLVVGVIQRQLTARAALGTVGRVALPTVGVSLWWAVGLAVQGSYGLPILQLTETVRTTSASSLPTDLLRGIGNWFFYGGDRLGSWLDQSSAFSDRRWLVAVSFAVPILALGAAAVVRWRHRTYFGMLIVVGTVVGVGAWPYDDPSALGRVFSDFASDSSIGLAFRNTARVVPLIVLGIAGLLAAGISALGSRRLRVGAGSVVVGLVVLTFVPVWEHGYLSDRLVAPEDKPSYLHRAAAAIDRSGDTTRVLEIPGSDFGAYRWGNTVDPITPGLVDRPWVGRESLPSGTAGSADLLAALDRRVQEGTFDPAALAPVARLFAAGTALLRSDLEYERYDTPRPRRLWSLLTAPLPPGLKAPIAYGPTTPNRASPALPLLDEPELATPADAPWPPALALFPVVDPVPIVHLSPTAASVVLAGDGEGILDAIEAGLLDGTELVRYSSSLDDVDLRDALREDAVLLVTDTNRRRARRWTALRDVTGPTERAGQTAVVTDVDDHRLPVVDDERDRSRSVVEQRGGRVDATSSGDRDRYTPEDRPLHAFDGSLRTAWRAGGGGAPGGERIVLVTDRPVRADRVTLVQPQNGPRERWLTRVAVTVDGDEPIIVELDDRSRSTTGQVVRFPSRRVHRLEIELLATSSGPLVNSKGAAAVGFAEIVIDDVHVEETVRLPVDLLTRAGVRSDTSPLAIVLSRMRGDPARSERQDEELAIARRFEIPSARSFALTGTARVAPNASDPILDETLGTTVPGATFDASTHLVGDAGARASRAFDGDGATAWTAALGTQEGQWVGIDGAAPVTFERADLTIVADGRHSVPTSLLLEADGGVVRTLVLPPLVDGVEEGATQTVSVAFDPVTASSFRFVVQASRPVTTVDDRTTAPVVLPVAIAEVGIPGLTNVAGLGEVSLECRDDLVSVDGAPVSVHLSRDEGVGGAGLAVEACEGPLDLGPGSRRVRSGSGLETGLDVDRLVLRSGADGRAASDVPLVGPEDSGARVRVVDSGPTSFDLRVRSDGQPFWLVLGQSQSDGWKATTSAGRSLGTPELVDGYANGWLVRPDRAGAFEIELRWTPQGVVWWGIGASVLAILAGLGVLIATRRRSRQLVIPPDPAEVPRLTSPFALLSPTPSVGALVVTSVALGSVSALVSRPWIGLVVGTATLVAARVARGRVVLSAGAPVALAVAKLVGAPELGWLAVLLLLGDLVLAGRSAGGTREAEHPLSDDVLVDLGGAPGDRV